MLSVSLVLPESLNSLHFSIHKSSRHSVRFVYLLVCHVVASVFVVDSCWGVQIPGD